MIKSETLAVVALIAVLLVSSVMMGLLVRKIDMPRAKEEAKFFDVRTSTNAVVKVEVESADINNVGIKDALEILRNEQTNWLAVIGFFGVIFGLVVPVGSYLLQRQSLKEEREIIVKNCEDKAKQKIDENIARMKDELKLVLSCLSSNFDGLLANLVIDLLGGNLSWKKVTNWVIAFDMCLDCLVRAKSGTRIAEIVNKYKEYIEDSRSKHPSEWLKAIDYLNKNACKSDAFVQGNAYRELLGSDSVTYVWLKSFFTPIYPWKFA